jgi:hypothetical protein
VSPCAIAAGTSVGEGDTVHAVYLRPSDSELRLTDGSQGPVLSLAMDASRRPTAASDDAASVYYKEKPATE